MGNCQMAKILLLEDDESLNRGISLKLEKEGYEVLSAVGVKQAERLLSEHEVALVISDITVEDGDGLSFCKNVRKKSQVHFIFLTALDQEVDIVNGYDAGADDYITKPFSLMALRIRVENIWKRTRNNKIQIYEEAGYMFDFGHLDFKVNGQEISLSAPEQKLLKLFITHPGQTLPRDILVENIWTCSMEYVDENALSVTISRLRKKLEIKGKSSPVSTVYGIGYAWKHQGD